MPSPFPGMDPYLEDRELFPNLHDDLITFLQGALQERLPEAYYASSSRRTWIDVSDRHVEPDVNVTRQRSSAGAAPAGGVAVADRRATKPITVRVPEEEWWEPYLEVYTGRRPNRRLVASIEVVSPSNKTAGNKGRKLYLKKQREMLEAEVHLVEIDLLLQGVHTTAVPVNRLRHEAPVFDYHVCLRPFHNREEFLVYPIVLEQSLPVISVPLLPGDEAVEVDLQAVFERAYDFGPYRKEIDYANETPDPPLDEERMKWASDLIARWKASAHEA